MLTQQLGVSHERSLQRGGWLQCGRSVLSLSMLGGRQCCYPTFPGCVALGRRQADHGFHGGGNRAEYEEDNARIATLPGYIDNCDDPFDSTYAHFHYAVPEHRLKAAGVIAELMKLNGNGAEYQGARRVMDALNPDTAERYKKARIENSARISELIATLRSIENAA